jgi:MFS transporter, Spinster family, sphingosine-1-phosphate transporter
MAVAPAGARNDQRPAIDKGLSNQTAGFDIHRRGLPYRPSPPQPSRTAACSHQMDNSSMTRHYAWYVLLVLTAINFINYVDRQIIISLGPFIRRDLQLTYTGFGCLITAFMLIHSLTSLPLGMLSDRWVRRKIIAFGVWSWSAATFFCGLATNFAHLLLARAAVGIGEAAYAPPANSLLSDAFPPLERSRILGFFNLGMFLGGAAGLIMGGVLGDLLGWRACLYLVSLPGFLLGGLVWYLREPPPVTFQERTPVKALLCNPLLSYVLWGGVITAFSAGALIVWMPQFVTDVRLFRPRDAGIYIGAVGVSGGLLGVVTGSYLADWLQARWAWGRMATIGTGLILSCPFVTLSLYTTNHMAMMTYFFLGIFLMVWYTGPIIAVIHDVVPSDVKATAQALYVLLIHLLGDTFSPALVGKLADLHNLQAALLLPAVINVVAGVIFLLGCRRVARDITRRQEEQAETIHDLSRTGTTGL